MEVTTWARWRKLEPADHRHFECYLDWLLYLPPQRNRELYIRVRNNTLENHMPFVSIAESYGRELGQIEGRLEGIETALAIKFDQGGLALMPEIRKIIDPARLSEILQYARKATTIDEFLLKANLSKPQP